MLNFRNRCNQNARKKLAIQSFGLTKEGEGRVQTYKVDFHQFHKHH